VAQREFNGLAYARLVRDQAFKAIAMFLKRIEGMAAAMVRASSTFEGSSSYPARYRHV